jgi:hypothetical protein
MELEELGVARLLVRSNVRHIMTNQLNIRERI